MEKELKPIQNNNLSFLEISKVINKSINNLMQQLTESELDK